MQYVLLLHESESHWDRLSEAEQGEIMAGYGSFSQQLAETKKLLGGERLQPTSTATTVRVREDKVALTDGPFTETKEQLGPDRAMAVMSMLRMPTSLTGRSQSR